MVAGLTLVLLHSPLVGPRIWQPVAAELTTLGYAVVVPRLNGIADAPPPYYRWLTDTAYEAIGSSHRHGRVILVGHSRAGALLPAIGERLADELYGAIFVDATLPHPGVSRLASAPADRSEFLRSLAVDGRLPPWHEWFPPEDMAAHLPDEAMRAQFVAEMRGLPLAFFAEPEPVVDGWPPPRCAYLQLSEAYEPEAAEAERRGWATIRVPLDHLAMLTQPERISGLLDRLTTVLMDA